MKVDIIIHNGHLMTMEGKGVGYIADGAVAIKHNKIEAVGQTQEILREYTAERHIDAANKLIMPGFIDAHIHTGIAIFRGVAQDMSNWMQKGLWPFQKHLRPDESAIGSMVNIIEGIKAGTTTFCDYDGRMDLIVNNYKKIGARARVAELVNEIPDNIGDLPVGELYTFESSIGETKLNRNLELYEKHHDTEDGRITVILGPHGPDMMSLELLKEVKNHAEKLDTKLHMHVAQGDREINQMEKRYGKRSIEFLDEHDFLNERLIAVHLTEATDEETAFIAKSGASMIYCAGSIGIIDGMVPPVQHFLDAGGTACLGSDQAPGNNSNNMFNEMKFAAILNKVKYKNPQAFHATQALRMATIEAAKVMGIDHEVGSLRSGKKADIILVDLTAPAFYPVLTKPIRNIVPNLVYSARGDEVDTAIIDGKVIMENKQILTIHEKEEISKAQQTAENIASRAEEDILKADSDILQMVRDGLL
ncbi:N-ethylammeline chlorohydrolase [Oceanobacillus oncorhynchi subsp. incaldanensis]|uniref:Amidohydrolase family protein n=1 Tax=Oceanobacillus aidingensis TaxID=645964 RepID=A0ABV9JS97_9BACI|nr:amidohydrolase [Oceanobacillus oncorhynchi]MDM8099090.1 amidohydrolase [Oceanobacillus oncorhynchi]UUI39871.1 amidohydrolase [Oceanobacillus oncorhynchi]GIO20243.1 N-ethylammeline chlorohydrolase [Oceanobacillus oncorhynchi subsp. incaldanensis]